MKFQAITKYRNNAAYDYDRIGIPTDDGIEMVFCRDILRCEAKKTHCIFYLVNGSIMYVKRNIGYFERKLVASNFFKAHKSHLVNMRHVKDYREEEESYLLLSDQSTVPVSVRRRNLLMKRVKFAVSYLALKDKLEKMESLKKEKAKNKKIKIKEQ